MIEHAGKEMRVAGHLPNSLGADASCGQKAAELFGIGGEEAERRNGQSLGASRRAPSLLPRDGEPPFMVGTSDGGSLARLKARCGRR